MNKKAAELALAHDYGHSLGAMIKNRGRGILETLP